MRGVMTTRFQLSSLPTAGVVAGARACVENNYRCVSATRSAAGCRVLSVAIASSIHRIRACVRSCGLLLSSLRVGCGTALLYCYDAVMHSIELLIADESCMTEWCAAPLALYSADVRIVPRTVVRYASFFSL